MITSFCELSCKEVINLKDGRCIGRVGDIEFDTKTVCITALVVFGRKRFFGLFGREEDIVIKWAQVKTIGADAILVEIDFHCRDERHFRSSGGFLDGLFN